MLETTTLRLNDDTDRYNEVVRRITNAESRVYVGFMAMISLLVSLLSMSSLSSITTRMYIVYIVGITIDTGGTMYQDTRKSHYGRDRIRHTIEAQGPVGFLYLCFVMARLCFETVAACRVYEQSWANGTFFYLVVTTLSCTLTFGLHMAKWYYGNILFECIKQQDSFLVINQLGEVMQARALARANGQIQSAAAA